MIYGKNAAIIVFFSVFLIFINAQNLFCNLDFESYSLNPPFYLGGTGYQIQNCGHFNDQCWYVPGLTSFLVQKFLNIPTYTKMVKFYSNDSSIQICQNVNLQIGKKYNYTFQIAMYPQMATATAYSYINSALVKTVIADASTFPNLTSITYVFQADTIANTFCASKNHTWATTAQYNSFDLSAVLDNFYLYKIQSLTVQFQVRTDERQNRIKLSTVRSLPHQALEHIANNTVVRIGDETQNQVKYDIKGGILSILVEYDKIVDLKKLNIKINEQFITESNELASETSLLFGGLRTMFYPLSSQQIQKIDSIQFLGAKIYEAFFKLYLGAQAIGCSYLLQNFISFYSMITLYNFLNLSAQPSFSYNIIKDLSSIFLADDNVVLSYIDNILLRKPGKINEVFSQVLRYDESKSQQIMPQQINGYSWFGSLRVSPNFFENNYIHLSIFVMLLIKILFVYIIAHYLPDSIGKHLKKKAIYVQIFIVQFIVNSTTITISAMSVMYDSGIADYKQKINYLFQTLSLLIIICSPIAYYFVLQYRHQQKTTRKSSNKSKSNNKITRQVQKQFWQRMFSTLQISLQILVPILIVSQSKIGFVIILTLYFIGFYICFYNGYKYFPIHKKIYRALLLLLFGIHHFCFCFLSIVSILSDRGYAIGANVGYYCRVCGFVVIVSIIFGGMTQIIQFLVEMIFQFIMPGMKKAIKRMKKKNKVQQIAKKQESIIPVDVVTNGQSLASKCTIRVNTKRKQPKYQRNLKTQRSTHMIKMIKK